jgi:hypothetical protein
MAAEGPVCRIPDLASQAGNFRAKVHEWLGDANIGAPRDIKLL